MKTFITACMLLCSFYSATYLSLLEKFYNLCEIKPAFIFPAQFTDPQFANNLPFLSFCINFEIAGNQNTKAVTQFLTEHPRCILVPSGHKITPLQKAILVKDYVIADILCQSLLRNGIALPGYARDYQQR